MRTETKVINIYKFNELSDKAKEKALDNARDRASEDFSDFYGEDIQLQAIEIGALMGIEITKIFWSGFSSQGDGACFIGEYKYLAGAVEKIKEYAPNDKRLLEIAVSLSNAQVRHEGQLTASISSRNGSRYCHENTVTIDVDHPDEDLTYNCYAEESEAIREALKDFMRWIYKQLSEDYFYQISNEALIENINANDYEFTEDGKVY